jgi:hypothetical protein
MIIRRKDTIFTLLIVVSILMGMARTVQAGPRLNLVETVAQESSDSLLTCDNLDVIFIVDQSESMSRAGLASDPLDNRRYAISAMIDLLVDLAVDQCADSTYRVAVISFGGLYTVRVDLPLRNINPTDFQEGRALRNDLVGSLKADNLGQTYPKDAFSQANSILGGASQFGDESRKRVILFLTDGIPCSEGREGCNENRDFDAATSDVASYVSSLFPFDNDLLNAEACLAKLRKENVGQELPAEEVNACLKAMPENKQEIYAKSTYIYTILMKSDVSYPESTLNILKEMSESHAGRLVELKQNLAEVPTTMRTILSELVGINPIILHCGNPFAVNPYLKRLRLNIYNIADENKITLSFTDANGQLHQIHAGTGDAGFTLEEPYYTLGANERYVFQYPYPGQWQITAEDCEGVDVFAEPIDFKVEPYQPNLPDELPEYDIDPYYSADEQFQYKLEYQMRVGDDVIEQAPQALFAINVEARVTTPDGREYIYPMEYDAVNKKFVAADPLALPMEGVYQLTLTGTTLRHDGDIVVPENLSNEQLFTEIYTVFRFETQLKVFPVSPFILEPISPTQNQTIYHVHGTILDGWPLPDRALPVRVRISDRSGVDLPNLEDVFSDQNRAITATLADTQTITLLPDPEKPGEYVGELTGPGALGEQSLTYEINMDVVNDEYRPDKQTWEITINRGDGIFHRSIIYIVIFWMIVAVILALIAYNIAIRTNKVSGSLIFLDGSENIAEFGLYNGTNFRTIKNRELNNYPQLLLKGIKVRNVGKQRRATKQQDDEAGGFYSDEPQGIQVDCISTDGRKFPVILYPKTPAIYNEETMAQMVYEPVE